MSCSSLSGLRPAACNSPTSGNEILPSDRTGMERETSGSFQTLIANTSSLPITKLSSCGLVAEEASAFCAGCAVDEAGAVSEPACPQTAIDTSQHIATPTIPVLGKTLLIPAKADLALAKFLRFS